MADAVAFGDFLSGRARLQAADVGIRLAPRNPAAHDAASADEREKQETFLKQLKGKTPQIAGIFIGLTSCRSEIVSRSRHEQPEKSISFTGTAVLASALSGLPLASWLVITNDGMQSGWPPLSGTAASARILNNTGGADGIE